LAGPDPEYFMQELQGSSSSICESGPLNIIRNRSGESFCTITTVELLVVLPLRSGAGTAPAPDALWQPRLSTAPVQYLQQMQEDDLDNRLRTFRTERRPCRPFEHSHMFGHSHNTGQAK
jgi:hypothetical protein